MIHYSGLYHYIGNILVCHISIHVIFLILAAVVSYYEVVEISQRGFRGITAKYHWTGYCVILVVSFGMGCLSIKAIDILIEGSKVHYIHRISLAMVSITFFVMCVVQSIRHKNGNIYTETPSKIYVFLEEQKTIVGILIFILALNEFFTTLGEFGRVVINQL